MPAAVLSAQPPQVFNYQPYIQQQQQQQQQQQKIVIKYSNIPYIPPEVIRIILRHLKDDRKTLSACALVNHTFNLHVTPILYHTVSFTYPFTFTLFAKTVNAESQHTRLIRHLDLSTFSIMGLQKSNAATQNIVTSDILVKILRHCTMLEAISISGSLESSINLDVLKVLAFECKNLKSLDFCDLSKNFSSAIASLAKLMNPVEFIQYYDDDGVPKYLFKKGNNVSLLPHLERLSFHECPAIENSTILTILANSPNLTHLDLGGCSISDSTLNFLANETKAPQKLTHLLLARCKNISSEAIADLVVKCENLEVLNLYGDRDLATAITEYDLDTILASPSAKNLKSLDIGSSHITSHTLSNIQENCTSLTHLGIAKACVRESNIIIDFLKSMPNLQYIDLTGIQSLTSLNFGSIITNLQEDHSLHVIEISQSLSKKLGNQNGWMTGKSYTRRWFYAKEMNGDEKPDEVHPRKLDMAETGPERMSKIFKHYSFSV